MTPCSVVSGWERGVLRILQPTVRVSQVGRDQPLTSFTVQKIFKAPFCVSLFVVRPSPVFSCLHILPQTVSHPLSCLSSRTQHDSGCNKGKSKDKGKSLNCILTVASSWLASTKLRTIRTRFPPVLFTAKNNLFPGRESLITRASRAPAAPFAKLAVN